MHNDPPNKTEIRTIGLSRSGNHAIIHWLLEQLPGSYCFLNCVEPGWSPFLSMRPLHGDQAYLTNIDGLDMGAERAGRHARKDWLLYGYEDCFLGPVAKGLRRAEHEKEVGASARKLNLLILRDPFNLYASRRRTGWYEESATRNWQMRGYRKSVQMWKQHAREFLRERRMLRGETICVNYNRWATDPRYRKGLAETLGVPFTDAGYHRVPPTAGGSSFDGRRYNGRASHMATLDRWRIYREDPAFVKIFDEETMLLSERIFGITGGSLYFRGLREAPIEAAEGSSTAAY